MKILNKSIAILTSSLLAITGFSAINLSVEKTSLTAFAEDYTNQSECEEMLKLVNEIRAENGAEPLKLYPDLCELANTRSQELTELFSHDRPNGTTCFTILSENNISYYSAGENIAYTHNDDVQYVVDVWENSSGHFANMIDTDFTHIGIGMFEDNGTYYWTQLFIGARGDVEGEYLPTETTTSTTATTSTITTNKYMWGDANCDKLVDIADVVAIMDHANNSNKNDISTQGIKNSDVHGDENGLNSNDSATIQKFLAGNN